MISTSRESGVQAKQEGDTNESSKFSKPALSSSSRQWSGFRNPRIVRVSRSFGGKDRHSKVCTIRGLRDRRIRLSVPTAIQVYGLQDRLGLSQPSKVIDWLLDVTKNEIDKLPPLQIPQGLFGHLFHQQQTMLHSNTTTSSLSPFFDGAGGIKINSSNDVDDDHVDHQDQSRKYWGLEASSLMRAKGKEVERDEDKNQELSAHRQNQKYFYPGLFDINCAMPLLNPYYHWEPSNLSLSQFGSGHELVLSQQLADQNSLLYSNAAAAAAASLAFPSRSHHHHLFFCPPGPVVAGTMPSLFPTYAPFVSNAAQESTDLDQSSRKINHFQFVNSNTSSHNSSQHNNLQLPFNSLATGSSQVKPFSLNAESNPDKEDTYF